MRIDHKLVERFCPMRAKVLDLGCGDGELLSHLRQVRHTQGYGIEIDQNKIVSCLGRGLSVIEQDLNEGLGRFCDNSFDVVVMARALQAVKAPDKLLLDMVRVGREVIVTFPNFAYWQNRVYLGIKGIMPISETLPHEWYDTPNIHLCTFKDFERLCHDNDIHILDTVAVSESQMTQHLPKKWRKRARLLTQHAPNILADVAVYRLGRA